MFVQYAADNVFAAITNKNYLSIRVVFQPERTRLPWTTKKGPWLAVPQNQNIRKNERTDNGDPKTGVQATTILQECLFIRTSTKLCTGKRWAEYPREWRLTRESNEYDIWLHETMVNAQDLLYVWNVMWTLRQRQEPLAKLYIYYFIHSSLVLDNFDR